MQHQIAHGVFTFRAARPDLLFGKAAQAICDAAAKLPELARGVIQKQAIRRSPYKPGYTSRTARASPGGVLKSRDEENPG
jgi:hypothetical protein